MAGGVFPMWGLLFSETINLLFRLVAPCDTDMDALELGFESCQAYWDFTKEDMQQKSFRLAGYWVVVAVACIVGNMVTFYGFGNASERLNKRVRDVSFTALLRQEVAFFDKRSVGSITSQLQDDAARIHAFSGEPVRSLIVALSSVITGVVLAFVVSEDKCFGRAGISLHVQSHLTPFYSSCGPLLSSLLDVYRSWAPQPRWK